MANAMVQEIFSYYPVATGSASVIANRPVNLAGFVCSVSGTLQIRDGGSGGTIVVATMSVQSGLFHPLPFALGVGLYAELAGGATGTFAAVVQ